jgi:hypothetical protein
MTSPLDDFVAWQRKLNSLPPAPHSILTSHAVPYGRAYRQWDSKGRLLIWVNRGEVADLPRAAPGTLGGPPIFGIPVRNA